MNFEENINEPKILIISNNALSHTNNNGKTLASFFKNFSDKSIAQLYFNSELPTYRGSSKYYQITDRDVAYSILDFHHASGKEVSSTNKRKQTKNSKSDFFTKVKESDFIRLFRELIWKLGKWNSKDLNDWLDEISPDIIFFCAGDSGFAYDIVKVIKRKYNTKLITYITDDYVLPRKTYNLFWWIRRNYIMKKMKKAVSMSDKFMTISDKMKETYKKLFEKDSIVAVNISDDLKYEEIQNISKDSKINLIYTGGLHFNRFETLELLGKSILNYNNTLKEDDKKVFLSIYSNKKPNSQILKKLNITGACSYSGSLNTDELKEALNKADIPVHVESFDQKSIESTRLSISTKIPEYLSLGKPILAIGPAEVASMEYLKGSALCINHPEEILEKISLLLNDNSLREKLSETANRKYYENHNSHKIRESFYRAIMEMSI